MPTPPVQNESQFADLGAESDAPTAETGRTRRASNRTPLPDDLAAAGQQREIEKLRTENQELRALIEQAIAQEESFDQQLRDATAREAELTSRLQTAGGADDHYIAQVQERDETIRMLSDQIQQLEAHLQYSQQTTSNADAEDILRAVRERDELIQALTNRVSELDLQIAQVPPPPPSDEDLARMADELEKERCQFTLLRRELEEEKRTHMEESADFERQMREMEVQMSRERAEMARQRMELLQRLQAEIQTQADALQRGDSSLKDRLASLQRRPNDSAGKPSLNTGGGPPTPQSEKDSGFMRRFFGKK